MDVHRAPMAKSSLKSNCLYELLSGNGHYLSFVIVEVILPDECDSAILHREYAVI